MFTQELKSKFSLLFSTAQSIVVSRWRREGGGEWGALPRYQTPYPFVYHFDRICAQIVKMEVFSFI